MNSSPLCGSLEIWRKLLLDISRDGNSFRVAFGAGVSVVGER